MVLIGTIKPYGLNTKSVDFATKYTTIQEDFAICGPIL